VTSGYDDFDPAVRALLLKRIGMRVGWQMTEASVQGSVVRYEMMKWARQAAMSLTPLGLQVTVE
jgi:hypothetical protein